MTGPAGHLIEISGALVRARCLAPVGLNEVVYVGDERLVGEVIALDGDVATMQVYEETAGLSVGAPVEASGGPLTVTLGPGLLGGAFDGIQRPLDRLAISQGDFLGRGQHLAPLSADRLWEFRPTAAAGAMVNAGDELGIVRETDALDHRVLVPPGVSGRLADIAAPGAYRIGDRVGAIGNGAGSVDVGLAQRWRVRVPRPFRQRLRATAPMLTGQRVLDTFFPLSCGSAAGMPGGFGTGKTVMQHQLCRWARADVIVFVGCGERGNELTEMLWKLPGLVDPRTGRPLAERTILVANTSNMPVPAREASIYTGATIAEYYRDMGYHVLLLADSTSRWAEALREISGRLGEIPAEEGYPSYLSSRLAAFYERAGHVVTLGGREGSLTIISAISPAGGDVTEPVTRHTQRFTGCFWTLDKRLAEARVFPAVSVEDSYSAAFADLESWWHDEVSPDWAPRRREALKVIEEAGRVRHAARLVGEDSLPDRQRLVLRVAELFEEGFLRQSAHDAKDASCSPARQVKLLSLLLDFYHRGLEALDRGVPVPALIALPVAAALARAKSTYGDDEIAGLDALAARVARECAGAGKAETGGAAS
ncbi:MAG: V-type ATP synthase subunit A [Acidobacteriia bacterium]|nr:V-type ATP synthase subunit A [Terriglobia bacterium]